jgi:hypothetical protein
MGAQDLFNLGRLACRSANAALTEYTLEPCTTATIEAGMASSGPTLAPIADGELMPAVSFLSGRRV